MKTFVDTLLERGWVDLFEKTPADAHSVGWVVVPVDQRRGVMATLADDVDWNGEGIRTAVVRRFVIASDKGDAEFHEDLRRRGLYVDNRRRGRIRWPLW